MKYDKLFGIILLMLFSLISVNAIGTVPDNDNTVSYYKFENDVIDSVGNYNGTDTGTANVSGKIDWGRDFNSSDNIDIGDVSELESTVQFSVSGWYNFSSVAAVGLFSYGTVTNQHLGIFTSGSDFFVMLNNGANTYGTGVSAVGLNDSLFHHIVMVYNGSSPTDAGKLKLYIDNVSQTMTYPGGSIPATTYSAMNVFQIGRFQQQVSSFNGTIDEFAIFNYSIQADEVNFLYQNDNPGSNQQYPFVVTPQIQTNLSSVYNHNNISINLTTTSNVNMSYILDGGGLISIANDTNNIVLNLFNLSETTHDIRFKSEDVNGISWNNQTFLVDTISPTINVSNFTEWNDGYNVTNLNITLNISCNDTNLDIIEIVWDDNTTTNLSSTQYKLFNTNGNHTFSLRCFDIANNSAIQNGTIYINPYQYFYFYDTDNSQFITNFTFNNIFFEEFANFTVYDLGLGSSSLEFVKLGYPTQNFNITINTTSNINQTFNTTPAKISITIRDKDTFNIVSGENFTLSIIATVGLTTSTNTGTKNISNTFFLPEEYELIVTSANYSTETVYFNFTNQEVLSITVYVLNKNDTSTAIVGCVDGLGSAVVGATAEARQWDSTTSSYIKVSESKIPESGQTFVNVILNTKQYTFRCSFGSLVSDSVPRILVEDFTEIILTLSEGITSEDYFLDTVNYNFSENFINNISYINFTWTNTDGTDITGCIKYSRLLTTGFRLLINETCVTSSSAEIQTANIINSSYDIIAELGFDINNNFYPQKSYTYPGTISLDNLLAGLNIHYYILPLLELVSVLIMMSNVFLGAAAFILFNGIALTILVPDFMTSEVLAFIIFLAGLLIWVGYKRR